MFLLRTMFWLGLVILLMPAREADVVSSGGHAIRQLAAYSAAMPTAPAGCDGDRSALECASGREGLEAAVAIFAASVGATIVGLRRANERPETGNLTADDIEPAWSFGATGATASSRG